MPTAPKMKKTRDFRVSLSVCILCVLLACLFVFMATYVTVSLQAERKINEAYARAGEYEKLLEVAEKYDEYYLYGMGCFPRYLDGKRYGHRCLRRHER